MSAISKELAIFHRGPQQRAVVKTKWINFLPLGQISNSSTIEFQVSGTAGEYIVPSKTYLHVKVRILKETGQPIEATDNVSLTNLALHSMFRQVDAKLNGQLITSSIGTNYPYKAMLDVLLKYPHDVKDSQLQVKLVLSVVQLTLIKFVIVTHDKSKFVFFLSLSLKPTSKTVPSSSIIVIPTRVIYSAKN